MPPVQFVAVAVDWKATAVPAVPVEGTAAEQAREHTGAAEMVMLPLWVQGVAPETVAV